MSYLFTIEKLAYVSENIFMSNTHSIACLFTQGINVHRKRVIKEMQRKSASDFMATDTPLYEPIFSKKDRNFITSETEGTYSRNGYRGPCPLQLSLLETMSFFVTCERTIKDDR
ncbi:hypothetical protein NPIL_235961 [Nephila pilipes]|uniref:Uncharacterized protein n=1 Tax=Nephila pilipes TaxID=299642 RepID=A0A8X6U089_NEPPI|nr:hypothetical protein NPIL_235961 [Nephila pilipes]